MKILNLYLLRPLVVLAAILAWLVPTSASASTCSTCYWRGYENGCTACSQVVERLNRLIQQSTDAINQNVNLTRSTLSQELRDATSSIVGAIEKSQGAAKELKQAELNYEAAADVTKTAARADELFTGPTADITDPSTPANACATAATAEAAATAGASARLTGRARTAQSVRQYLYTSDAGEAMRQVVQTYNSNFCSAEDAQRGRCPRVAPIQMQAASLTAGSLLAPASMETYNDQESLAAAEYIKMVAGPIPVEPLPITVEKSDAGQKYLMEQRSAAATLSMSLHSLNQIFASKSSEEAGSLSIVGLMKKFVEDRYGNDRYEASLRALGEKGLLVQIAQNMAFQNWMDYHAYLQAERTEAVLATSLALEARDRNEARLRDQRMKALKPQ